MKRMLMLLLLAACGETQPLLTPVDVKIPVILPCRGDPLPTPSYATRTLKPNDDLFVKTRAVLVELEQRKATEAGLQAALAACPKI